MKYPLPLLCGVFCLLFTSKASAEVVITIQPSANLADIVWTVSWDSLDGNQSSPTATWGWDSMDPATGAETQSEPWGGSVREISFNSIGDPFTATYDAGGTRGFGDGVDGVVSTDPGWGVGPNHINGVNNDGLYIFNTLLNGSDPFPTTGSFVLVVPGANLANYNIGTFTNNPNVTITVTATPVPEPSTFALLGLAMITGFGIYKRKTFK